MTTDEAMLPAGWSRRPLGELCSSIQAGPAYRAEDKEHAAREGDAQVSEGIPLVLPRDLQGRRIITEDASVVPTIRWERARTLAKYELAAGDILLTRTGTVGRCALVGGEHAGWLFHPNLVRLRLPGKGPVTAAYLVAHLSATVAQDWIRTRGAAVAVIPSLSIRTLGELPVLLPPTAEQESIGATLAALDDKIQAHAEIARATGVYRDVLADALMNGVLSAES